jgi:hypothetical protein
MIDPQELESALNAHGVYDVGTYGWASEDDVDDEFVGHAMWQTDAVFEPEWNALNPDDEAVGTRPGLVDEWLTVAGHDFIELLRLSRLSIGLMLLHRSSGTQISSEPSFYELFYIDATAKLDIAMDRLRTFFVVAITQGPLAAFASRGNRFRRYSTPFDDAEAIIRERPDVSAARLNGLSALLVELARQAAALWTHRERRNALVHETATSSAHGWGFVVRLQRELFDRRAEAENHEPASGAPTDHAAGVLRNDVLGRDAGVEATLAYACDWFHLLIRTSNLVFQVEYQLRQP